jgi:hypothetical protein
MELWYGDTLIWKNPPEIGYFGVKLRKQIREEEIIAMIPRRIGWAPNPTDYFNYNNNETTTTANRYY